MSDTGRRQSQRKPPGAAAAPNNPIAASLATRGCLAHKDCMDLKQVRCFLALAETLNFTEASRRCGVSQPSLTRAIQRLEEELGGKLIYRDGKHSRLTPLGRDVHAEFVRIETALANVREHSENSVLGRRRVLDIAVVLACAEGQALSKSEEVDAVAIASWPTSIG